MNEINIAANRLKQLAIQKQSLLLKVVIPENGIQPYKGVLKTRADQIESLQNLKGKTAQTKDISIEFNEISNGENLCYPLKVLKNEKDYNTLLSIVTNWMHLQGYDM